jgi:hypothetical protein
MHRVGVVFALAIVGCSSDPGLADIAIRDGVSDPASSAVVGIYDDSSGATCTGALIAPNLVLTAQHCVAPVIGIPSCADDGRFGPAGAPGSYHVTTRPMLTATPSDYHAVAEIAIPPGGDRVCGHDVALLVLAANVPAGEASPIAPRFDPAPSVGELYAAVGFGGTDDLSAGAGERRRRDGLAVSCVGAACGGVAADSEWTGEAGVCPGDSGGPAIDGSGEVIGVASRGAFGCVSPVYALLEPYAPWMRAEGMRAATAGGYPAPAWVGASDVDGGSLADGGTPDAAAVEVDAAPDAGTSTPASGGGCSVLRARGAGSALALVLALALLWRRRSPRR